MCIKMQWTKIRSYSIEFNFVVIFFRWDYVPKCVEFFSYLVKFSLIFSYLFFYVLKYCFKIREQIKINKKLFHNFVFFADLSVNLTFLRPNVNFCLYFVHGNPYYSTNGRLFWNCEFVCDCFKITCVHLS